MFRWIFVHPFAVRLGVLFSAWTLIANAATEPVVGSNLLPPVASGPAANPSALTWTYWSPRPEIAHEHAVVRRNGTATLKLRARDFTNYGFWQTPLLPVAAGRYYRFSGKFEVEDMPADQGAAFAVLSWYSDDGTRRELQRDYIDHVEANGTTRLASRTVQAPVGATRVRVEVGLRRVAVGTAYWRDLSFAEASAPAPRIVRIATTRLLPSSPATIEANTKLMAEVLDAAGAEKPDLVLLSENFNTRSVRISLAEKAQPIPGPLTTMLSAKAKRFGMHVVTTLPERDGTLYHNTAVWIDRAGRIAGKYRKVHLTIGEMEAGLTPGSEYPVFDLDIGRVGIVTCWDNWFPEPMRILRLRGAEIVLMPLAGDGSAQHWESVWRARAMDNGVYLATSSTVGESPSRIIDPTGEIVAETKRGYSIAEIDLNREWRLRYLSVGNGTGEARSLYFRERRPDTYGPLLKDAEPATSDRRTAGP